VGGPSPNASAPTVLDSTIYVRMGGSLLAIDAETGTVEWTVSDIQRGSVTAGDDAVFLSLGQEVAAFSTADGTERWRKEIGYWSRKRAPAFADGTLYVGGDALRALSAKDGGVQWSADLSANVTDSPTVARDTVYAGTEDGSLHAIGRGDGSTRWTAEVAPDAFFGLNQSTVLGEHRVYVAVRGDAVYALDAEDGTEQWKASVESFGVPVRAGNRLYVPHVGRLMALDANSGELLWKFETQHQSGKARGVAVTEDGGYFASADGTLYALE
jgi:outer membrane protein assembly factor BamB